jgi:hypothetical protein
VAKRRVSPSVSSLRHSAPHEFTQVRVCCTVIAKRASVSKSETARPPSAGSSAPGFSSTSIHARLRRLELGAHVDALESPRP